MPGDWREATLGDAIRFVSGSTPSKAEPAYWGGDTPWVTAKDMKSWWVIDSEDRLTAKGAEQATWIAPPGTALILVRGMTLHNEVPVVRVRKPSAFNQDVKAAVPQHGVLPGFAPYLLAGLRTTLLSRVDSAGHGTGRLHGGVLRVLPIRLPPASEQEHIADLLGVLDDKMELNRRTAETLEAMARTLFKSWFVNFDPVYARIDGRTTGLRDDLGDLFPDRFAASGLPEGWTTAFLGDVVSVLETGSRPKGGVSAYSDGVPSIGAESIVGIGKFNFSKTKYIPEAFWATLSRGRIEDGDILIYKDGGKPGLFEPHITLVGEGFPFRRAAINEHVYRVRALDGFGQSFLFLALSSEACMDEMRARGTGVAIPGLNSTEIRKVSIPTATAPIRSAFEGIVSPLLARILVLSGESLALANLRDILLPGLISGDLRLPDAERLVAAA